MTLTIRKFCYILLSFLTGTLTVQAQQISWDSIVVNGFGNTNNIQVLSLMNYNNTLYAGTSVSNSQVSSADLYSSVSGNAGTWNSIHPVDSILSLLPNTSFNCLSSTNSGTGYLFAGTGKDAANHMHIYRKSGNVWTDFGPLHLSDTTVNYSHINAMTTFSMNGNGDSLFFAVDNYNTGAQIYASPVAAPNFTLVYQLPTKIGSVGDMKIFKGKIFACSSSGTGIYISADGHHWMNNLAADTGISTPGNACYSKMAVFNGALYVGITNYSSGSQIYMTTDGISWSPVVTSGFGHGANFSEISDLHTAYGKLWISSTWTMPSIQPKGHGSHAPSGMPITYIFNTSDGVTIKTIDSTGFDGYNSSSCLADMNHFVYVGTYNNNLGAQIWRTCVAPSPGFSVPDVMCTGTSFVFSDTASGVTKYKWYINGTLVDTLHSSYTYSASTTGTVAVKLMVYNNSCMDSLTQWFPVHPGVSVHMGGNPTICYGDSIKLGGSITGGTAPISYTWCTGAKTDSIKVSPTTLTTYTLTISDNYGCTSTDSAHVNVNPFVSVSISSNTYSCSHDSMTIMGGATGGLPPYSYTWGNGSHIDSLYLPVLVKTTFSLSVTDAMGCHGKDTLTVGVVPGPVITGTVTAPLAGTINSGKAYLIKYNSLPEKQFVVDTTNIIAGRYTFTHVDGGSYFVYAKANAASYPNVEKTYYPNADDWIKGTLVYAPCQTSDTANIVMLELTPPAGNATFYGMVEQGPDYGHTHKPQHHPAPHQPGDPIPGLDVNLEQHPGGIMVAHDTTDIHGNYHFDNIPPGQYDVYVDIPGLGMVSQYTRTVTGTESFTQLNYTVDSTHIYKDSVLVTAVIQPGTPLAGSLKAAPNPFRDALSIAYTVEQAGTVNISLFNLLGQEIMPVIQKKQDTGDYVISLDSSPEQLPPGVYLLRMTLNGKSESRRLVRIR